MLTWFWDYVVEDAINPLYQNPVRMFLVRGSDTLVVGTNV